MVGDPRSKQLRAYWRMARKRRCRASDALVQAKRLEKHTVKSQREGEELTCAGDVSGGWMEELR